MCGHLWETQKNYARQAQLEGGTLRAFISSTTIARAFPLQILAFRQSARPLLTYLARIIARVAIFIARFGQLCQINRA